MSKTKLTPIIFSSLLRTLLYILTTGKQSLPAGQDTNADLTYLVQHVVVSVSLIQALMDSSGLPKRTAVDPVHSNDIHWVCLKVGQWTQYPINPKDQIQFLPVIRHRNSVVVDGRHRPCENSVSDSHSFSANGRQSIPIVKPWVMKL